MSKLYAFEELPVGTIFRHDRIEYVKTTTRTARLTRYVKGRAVFYFRNCDDCYSGVI